MFNEQVAWLAVNKAIQDIETELTTSPRSKIISITIGGSLVRGDYIEDLSDVDVYTLVRGNIQEYWDSEEHKTVRSNFETYLSQYKGHSHNPFVWDDVSICEEDIPKTLDDLVNQRIKALGIYLFDFIENH
ncbi:MAG: nucleotidyltransferase domain-containing protein, partial [Dehalococcoidales bacterium]